MNNPCHGGSPSENVIDPRNEGRSILDPGVQGLSPWLLPFHRADGGAFCKGIPFQGLDGAEVNGGG